MAIQQWELFNIPRHHAHWGKLRTIDYIHIAAYKVAHLQRVGFYSKGEKGHCKAVTTNPQVSDKPNSK